MTVSARRTTSGGRETRSRIVDAAVELFAAKGYQASSTRDIAAAAGMSAAAVYFHFRSKEDLFFEIVMDGHRSSLEHVLRGLEGSSGPVDRLSGVVRNHTLWHARGHTAVWVANSGLVALEPEHLSLVIETRRSIKDVFRNVLSDGQQSGVFAIDDISKTTLSIIAMGTDVARWFRDDGRWTAEEVADHYSSMALRMAGVAGDPGETSMKDADT